MGTGRHAVILCHPDPRSFDHALANVCCDAVRAAGRGVVLRDLYAMGFDPVLKADERPTIADPTISSDGTAELDMIGGSDVFVLVYPIWFGSPPAMLKGYIERVLGTGAMPLQFQQEKAKGVLADKLLVSFTSSATDEHWLATQGELESLIAGFDRYIQHGFAMQPSQHYHFGAIRTGMDEAAVAYGLKEVTDRAALICRSLSPATRAAEMVAGAAA